MLIMPCIFGKDDDKVTIGLRKVSVQKRRSKKSPGQLTKIYYLPILKNEVERLGLDENSLLKAEIALLPAIEREETNAETKVSS